MKQHANPVSRRPVRCAAAGLLPRSRSPASARAPGLGPRTARHPTSEERKLELKSLSALRERERQRRPLNALLQPPRAVTGEAPTEELRKQAEESCAPCQRAQVTKRSDRRASRTRSRRSDASSLPT